jgi:hypothetical protein
LFFVPAVFFDLAAATLGGTEKFNPMKQASERMIFFAKV